MTGRVKRKRRIRINKRRAAVSLIVVLAVIIGIVLGLYSHFNDKPTPLREPVAALGDIPVTTDFIPENTMARPGQERKIEYIVIHETGNTGRNAGAESHNNYLHQEAENQQKSWHYTVDDKNIYYHVPDNEIAFHAGDRLDEDGGNMNGIGIEICINPESEYEQALKNAAGLTAMLLDAYELDLNRVKTHQDFSGKHCPDLLLAADRWSEFLDMVEAERNEK